MKVLLSAYACEPGLGSEPGVGWNIAKHLSSKTELVVITRMSNRLAIESSNEEWIHGVRWVFWDPPKVLTFWKKKNRGVQIYYLMWQLGIRRVVSDLLTKEAFDLIHHITFGKYWIPSFLSTLPCPFIFGPVGGGEYTPPLLAKGQRWKSRILDLIKAISAWCITQAGKKFYRNAAWTFAATSLTETALRKLGVTRLSLLPQSGIGNDDVAGAIKHVEVARTAIQPLKLITAARLIHWKAIDLAIEAVAIVRKDTPVHLTILQTGPELESLRRLAAKLGVEDIITFKGRLPKLDDVFHEIAAADALVHPALHEAFGQSCIESLAIGVPVICLDWGGPGIITDSLTGFAVKPSTRLETIHAIATSMKQLHNELKSGISRSNACCKRAYEVFHWDILTGAILDQYRKILRENDKMANQSHENPD